MLTFGRQISTDIWKNCVSKCSKIKMEISYLLSKIPLLKEILRFYELWLN